MTTSRTIQTSSFDTLPVIVFKNTATDSIEAWVCENNESMNENEELLRSMKHIEVLKTGHSVVK